MTDVNDLLGGGASAQFENVGDFVEGKILSSEARQQTDLETQAPVFWDPPHNTRPKHMIVLTLQTSQKDSPEDDGVRQVYLTGNRFTATQKATRKLEAGGYYKLTFTELSDREVKKGYNRAKLYKAEYKAPDGVSEVLAGTGDATDNDVAASPARPLFIPEDVWNSMPLEARVAVAAKADKVSPV